MDFPITTPESVGIDSRKLISFVNHLNDAGMCMHGFAFIRYGKMAAEGYWAPFHKDRLHRMYSVSKSFVSLAIGLLIDEGRITLDDQVYTYFPERVVQPIHPYTAAATIRDLLMMTTQNSDQSYTVHDKDWIFTFFNTVPSHPSGTAFSYDTAATVVLTALVERLTGKTFLAYMQEKMLDEIGFSKDTWCVKTPEGYSWGGSGVLCTMRDMASVAQLLLNDGVHNGKQLLSKEYVRAATSRQVDITYGTNGRSAGYGYQIWRRPNNGFAFNGMGGQFAFAFPDKDLLFVCTADIQACTTGGAILNDQIDALYETIGEPLPENPEAVAELRALCDSLTLHHLEGDVTSPVADKVNGKTYIMDEGNPMGLKWVRFVFEGDEGRMEFENAQGEKVLKFGMSKNVFDTFPQDGYFTHQIGVPGTERYPSATSAIWAQENKLVAYVYAIGDFLGCLHMDITFKGDDLISIHMVKVAEWFFEEYQGFAGGKLA